ncbi:MAG: YhcH/YjgK/YiaL family protein [Armatimonadota bacterium]
MIIDNISNASIYYRMGRGIETALRFLESRDLTQLEPGRYELEGDEIYFIVIRYDTKPIEQGAWEAHRQYADVQFIVSGTERMGYTNLQTLQAADGYDDAKDIEFLNGEGNFITMNQGDFAVFFPQDAHMPCIAVSNPEPVFKVVVKVRVDRI